MQDFEQVFLSETGAARIRWIVYEDCLGVGFDLGFEVVQVDLPLLLRDQVVVVKFDAEVLANRLAKRESGPCN